MWHVWGEKVHKRLWWRDLKIEDHLEGLDVDDRIVSK
jgi:hypothetical protein